MPAATLWKLKRIAGGLDGFQPLVEPIRESPSCQICGKLDLIDGQGRLLPNSELWIPAGRIVYASPIAILHYVEVHNYRPPAEYVEAVDALEIGTPFIADDIYRMKLRESGWFNRAR